jgi:hypothetical protein
VPSNTTALAIDSFDGLGRNGYDPALQLTTQQGVTTMKRIILGLPLIALSLSCGGGGNTLNQTDAAKALQAAQNSAELALGAVNDCSTCLSNGQALTAASLEVPCPGGGSITVDGTADDTTGSWDLVLAYNMCSVVYLEETYVIDGSLDYSGQSTQTGGSFSMDGELSFSGAVEGSCNYSLSLTVTEASVTANGNYCGYKFSYSSQQ